MRNRARCRIAMHAMVRAFLLSLAQLADRAVLGVLVRSLAVTLAAFAAAGAAGWWLLDALLGGWTAGRPLAGAIALVATLLAGWLLFRAVAIAVIGVFADTIVAAVERRHYPAMLAAARPVSFARGLGMGAGSFARVVAVNLLLAPVYVALLVTGVGTAALFLLVNALLLGRDLGDMVAARHLPRRELPAWRRATRGRRFALGLVAAGLFALPVVNLLAPVVSAALATHLFHGTRA